MSLLDKLKDMFTEEVEDDDKKEVKEIKREPIKKEKIRVEIPSPVKKSREELHETKQEIIKEEVKKEDLESEKLENPETKEDYNFPFFDDSDFKEFEPKKEEKKEEPKKELYHGDIGKAYEPKKEEKHTFKPTPIISPVYGILDKNYQKEDIHSKSSKPRTYYDPKEASVDEIRNKAYGSLEDDIESTLFGKEEPKHEKVSDDKNDSFDDLLEAELGDTKDEKKETRVSRNAKETTNDDAPKEEKHKISDDELFSMIDSMYQNGGKQWLM